jgi:hypothetical protein
MNAPTCTVQTIDAQFRQYKCTVHTEHQWYRTAKGGYTLVTLPRIVTPYRDSVDETRDRVTCQKLVTRARVSSTLSRYGVAIRGNVISAYPP